MTYFSIKPYDLTRMESGPTLTPCGMMGRAGDELMGNFWPDVVDELGILGFYAERTPISASEPIRTIGHIIFFTKIAARRLAYPTCLTNESLDKTLYLWCINGLPIKDKLEHVEGLVRSALEFAQTKGFVRFEVCSAASGSQKHNETLLKFGFKRDETVKQALSAVGMEPIEIYYWETK